MKKSVLLFTISSLVLGTIISIVNAENSGGSASKFEKADIQHLKACNDNLNSASESLLYSDKIVHTSAFNKCLDGISYQEILTASPRKYLPNFNFLNFDDSDNIRNITEENIYYLESIIAGDLIQKTKADKVLDDNEYKLQLLINYFLESNRLNFYRLATETFVIFVAMGLLHCILYDFFFSETIDGEEKSDALKMWELIFKLEGKKDV